MPEVGSDCTCLAAINVILLLKKDENYYLQAFLNECKYTDKEVIRLIAEDTEMFSSNSD